MGEVMRGHAIDRAGKVFLGEDPDTIVIDGVRCTMEVLVMCVNLDPKRYFRVERNQDTMTVFSYDRSGLAAELVLADRRVLDAAQAKLDALGHGIAYDAACSVIESNCCRVDGVDPVSAVYWDSSEDMVDADALDHVQESVAYLEMRGLLDRHPSHAKYVSLRDESEGRG